MTQYAQSYGGYTCANCGWYVAPGFQHTCPNGTAAPATTLRVDHGYAYVAALSRIADALERIAAALAPDGSVSGASPAPSSAGSETT